MNTKWYNENHNNKGNQYADRPIVAAKEEFTGEDEPKVYCPECQFDTVIKEEFNDRCTRTTCGRIFNIKREDKETVETGKIVESDNMDDNAETLVSELPDALDVYYGRSKPEYQGGIKTLHDRGLKITSYAETGGDGKPLKRNRWS